MILLHQSFAMRIMLRKTGAMHRCGPPLPLWLRLPIVSEKCHFVVVRKAIVAIALDSACGCQ